MNKHQEDDSVQKIIAYYSSSILHSNFLLKIDS